MMPLKVVAPVKYSYRKEKKGAFRDRVHDLLRQVGLGDFASHFPCQLSGGCCNARTCAALGA